MKIHFDFETRSLCDLKKWGAWKYAEDGSTDTLCYAFAVDGGEPVGTTDKALHQDVLDALAQGAKVYAWNAAFEWLIWNRVCVPRYGWPRLDWGQMVDVMAQAATMNLPQALGACAEAVGMGADKQKSKRGSYLITQLCKPISAGKKKGEFREDADLLAELVDYCKQDVVAEKAIADMLPSLSPYEQAAWEETQRINERGLPVALDEIDNAIEVVQRETEYLNGELFRLTGITAATQRDKVLTELRSRGLELDDLTGDTIEAMLKRDDMTPEDARILSIRAQVCQTSTAKFAKMRGLACNDGRIHGLLTYHGASTGRDASRGLNAQNLARPPLKDVDHCNASIGALEWETNRMIWGEDVMAAAVSSLRGVIKAPEGYEFLDADFSSVENRVASWIAGQQDKLDAFAQGMDEYKVFATSMYGVGYGDVTIDMRQVSKSAVLGGMFGQGWKGLIDYAAPLGVVLDEAKAREMIDTYRAQYPEVQRTWYACGDAMLEAVRAQGVVATVGKLKFTVTNKFLRMLLPSGRTLSWYQPTIESREVPWGGTKPAVIVWQVNPMTKRYERKALIGSSAFQSSVQGTARDLLIHGVSSLQRAGYDVVLRVHDEALALVREGEGDENEFGNLLCQQPAWAQDLPLAFKAWRGKRFRK